MELLQSFLRAKILEICYSMPKGMRKVDTICVVDKKCLCGNQGKHACRGCDSP